MGRHIRLAAFAVGVLILGSCAPQTAAVSSDPPALRGSARATADAIAEAAGSEPTPNATPGARPTVEPTVAPPATAVATVTPSPAEPDDTSAIDPTAEPTEPDPTAAAPQAAAAESTRGYPEPSANSGCFDATDLGRQLSTSPIVAEIAAPMPDRLWMCPNTPENLELLACYPNTTDRILTAYVKELGADVADPVDQLRAENVVFCAAGGVYVLGPDGSVVDTRALAD